MRTPYPANRTAAEDISLKQMTSIAIRTTVLFAVACTVVAVHAAACPSQKTVPARSTNSEIIRFAIAGLVDIDNDGKSDIDLIRRIIAVGGGVIDAELEIDGKLTGQLRQDTAYVIVGKLPDKTTVSPIVAQHVDAFMRHVAESNTRVIQLDELLEWGSRRTAAELDAGSVFRQRSPPLRRHGNEN